MERIIKLILCLECSGAFRGKSSNYFHIEQGAKKVLVSAPGEKDVDATIVYGVNHNILKSTDQVSFKCILHYKRSRPNS